MKTDQIIQTKTPGIHEVHFANPYPVTVFPNSDSFNPVQGVAIGEELNDLGGKRLIVRYDSPPKRKVTNQENHWPNGLLYLSKRDVEGWREEQNA